jgi:hypothetical protein
MELGTLEPTKIHQLWKKNATAFIMLEEAVMLGAWIGIGRNCDL